MTRYRLTARAQMHGEIREPGYVFTLADGEKGPHRTVSSRPGVNITDHLGAESSLVDEPLYVELSEEHDQAVTEAEAKALDEADAHAEACAARDAEQAKVEEGETAESELEQDGPTIAEWVAAGYAVDAYPPSGYASRSTAEEIAAFKPAPEEKPSADAPAGDDAAHRAGQDADGANGAAAHG